MSEVKIPVGSVEYLYADVTGDVALEGPVEMGLGVGADEVVWQEAQWVGDVGTSRSARLLLDGSLAVGTYYLFARVTDSPEVPVLSCGKVKVVTR